MRVRVRLDPFIATTLCQQVACLPVSGESSNTQLSTHSPFSRSIARVAIIVSMLARSHLLIPLQISGVCRRYVGARLIAFTTAIYDRRDIGLRRIQAGDVALPCQLPLLQAAPTF
ncbi:hypothetical protein C8Q73DRAFT_437712 [Cubamyces lactineus]|nr:hypothetical protein C8Q73DRAFT_437712 [Cubamyces lactineus]